MADYDFGKLEPFEYDLSKQREKEAEAQAMEIARSLSRAPSGNEGREAPVRQENPDAAEIERLSRFTQQSIKAANVAPFAYQTEGGTQVRGRAVNSGPYIDVGGGVSIPLKDAMIMLDASYGKVPSVKMDPNVSFRAAFSKSFADGGPAEDDADNAVRMAKELWLGPNASSEHSEAPKTSQEAPQDNYFDPMGNPTVAQAYEQPADKRPGIYEKVVDTLSAPVRTYVDKTKEAAEHGSHLMSEAGKSLMMEDGRLPINAIPLYTMGALGTVFSPLTGAAETLGEGFAQATGNREAGNRAALVAGAIDPTHVGAFGKAGMLAAAPMAAKAVEAAKTAQPLDIFGVMQKVSSVAPEGNVKLRPSISQHDLKGPDTQTVESFLNQIKGAPGITQEALDDIALRFHQNSPGMDLKQPISKAEFEKLFPSSKYEKVDLKESADTALAHWREEAARIADDEPERAIEEMLLQAGIPWRPEISRDVDEVMDIMFNSRRSVDTLPEHLRDALTDSGLGTLRDLDRAYENAREQYIRNIIDDFQANHWEGSGESGYMYETYQRLVPQSFMNDHPENYFEIGVAHPDQKGTYKHYQGFQNEIGVGLAGHFRGTVLPHGGPIMTARTFLTEDRLPGEEAVRVRPPSLIEAKPNSYLIEEIQSDAQKGAEQTGHLRNIHATVFKAAIQDALEKGFETVYYPTARTIAAARGYKDSKPFEPIYDKEIIKHGLKPLEKIPGVEVNKIGGDYYEINFSPDAKKYILKGPGQRLTNYAGGGTVGDSNEYASLDFSDVLPYNVG